MIQSIIDEITAFGWLPTIGIFLGTILVVFILVRSITAIIEDTKYKTKMKYMKKVRDEQIAFEHEVHDFVVEEVRRQLVDNKAIKDTSKNFNFGADGLRIE